MNDPQQIRRALTEIRRALDSRSRDELAEILALVFKEYVVEGSQALASGGQVIDARSDLEGLSFAELIVWLQTHLDQPELSYFEVIGSNVQVRVEGRLASLQPRAGAAPAAPPTPVVAPPTVRAMPMPATPAPAPRPASSAPTAATPATPPATSEEPVADTGTRFSLLEVD